mmetsp:Transcript_25599/g.50099  ORF Transcript_25599/g.50099 Transcript_25599/m.50099 type:complete len:137 (+) Transcript_25599:1519-1929(+)
MLGEILLWNPLASQPVKRILRTTLGALVGTMSVVERWFLQDVRGFPSQQRQKLSKKEAMGEADIRTEGEVRIFACLQDLDNGGQHECTTQSMRSHGRSLFYSMEPHRFDSGDGQRWFFSKNFGSHEEVSMRKIEHS